LVKILIGDVRIAKNNNHSGDWIICKKYFSQFNQVRHKKSFSGIGGGAHNSH
jgi:hypothetical protein